MAAIEKNVYSSMDDASLVWACIEPVIAKVRGKDLHAKMEVYSRLNEAQRALFMFQVLYGHSSHGIAGVFCELSYMIAIPAVWAELKESLLYFRADALARVTSEMEQLYHAAGPDGLSKDMPQLRGFDGAFEKALEQAVRCVASCIRENPGRFVQLS